MEKINLYCTNANFNLTSLDIIVLQINNINKIQVKFKLIIFKQNSFNSNLFLMLHDTMFRNSLSVLDCTRSNEVATRIELPNCYF